MCCIHIVWPVERSRLSSMRWGCRHSVPLDIRWIRCSWDCTGQGQQLTAAATPTTFRSRLRNNVRQPSATYRNKTVQAKLHTHFFTPPLVPSKAADRIAISEMRGLRWRKKTLVSLTWPRAYGNEQIGEWIPSFTELWRDAVWTRFLPNTGNLLNCYHYS